MPEKERAKKFRLGFKIFFTILMTVLIICILVPDLNRNTVSHPAVTRMDNAGKTYLESAFKRATVAYGLSRATNAIVSMLEEIDLGWDLGVEATLNPFEFLDPLNDLVERASWVLLLSMISTGIQLFLIRIFPDLSLTYILVPGLVLCLAGIWYRGSFRLPILNLSRKLILTAFFIRLIIPFEAAVSHWVYQHYLSEDYTTTVKAIEESNAQISEKNPASSMESSSDAQTPSTAGSNIWSTLKTLDQLRQLGNQVAIFSVWMKDLVPNLLENFISLIIVFVINTILLPLGVLFFVLYSVRAITGSGFGATASRYFQSRILNGEKPS